MSDDKYSSENEELLLGEMDDRLTVLGTKIWRLTDAKILKIRKWLITQCEEKCYCFQKNVPVHCITITKVLRKFIIDNENKNNYMKDLLSIFIQYINNNRCLYINDSKGTYLNFFLSVFEKVLPYDKDIIAILKHPYYFEAIKLITIINPYFKGFSTKVLKAMVTLFHSYIISGQDFKKMEIVQEVFFDNIDIRKIDAEFINLIVKCMDVDFCKKIAPIIEKYDGTLTQKHMRQAALCLPHSIAIVNALIARNLTITEEDVEIICRKCSTQAINHALDISHIIPQKSHFTIAIKRLGDKSIHTLNNGLIRPFLDTKIIDVLLNHGYKIDRDDIILAAKHRVTIPGMERFGIECDDELLSICYDNKFYPKYAFKNVSKEMMELQQLCDSRAPCSIKKHMKAHNLIPDIKCMENACHFKTNIQVVQYLIDNGGKINIQCVKNCANQLKSNRMLKILLKEFENNYQKEIQNYQNQIEQYKQLLKNNNINDSCAEKDYDNANSTVIDTNTNTNTQTVDTQTVDTKTVDTKTVDVLVDGSQTVDVLVDGSQTDGILVDGSQTVGVLVDGSQTDGILVDGSQTDGILIDGSQTDGILIDGSQTDGDTQAEADDIKIITIPQVSKRHTNKKRKYKIPVKYKKYFKTKTKAMSFIELRKDFISWIIVNEWSEGKCIILPKKLTKLLKLEEGNILVRDLDNLIYLFYK